MRNTLTRFTAAVAVAGCLATAACGDDDDASGATNAESASTELAGSATTTADNSATTSAAGDTATTSSAAGGRTGTVKIGLINTEGGALSIPDYRIGAEVAFDKVNATGGINGAQIETVVCLTDATPEGSINCANKMVEEKVAVVYVALDVATDAMFPVLADAKIPHVSQVSWGDKVKTDPNTHVIGTGNGAYILAGFKTGADRGAKRAALFVEDTPAGRAAIDDWAEDAKTFGIESTKTIVDAANADWLSAVSSGVASDTDMVFASLSEGGCVAMMTALRQIDFDGTVVVAGSCTSPSSTAADVTIGMFTEADEWVPEAREFAPAHVQAQIDEFVSDMEAAGQAELVDGYASLSYAAVRNLATILATIPASSPLDPTTITAALNDAKVSPAFMTGDLDCTKDVWKTEPVACRSEVMVYEVVAGPDGAPIRKPISDTMIDASTLQR
jgi:branched-chain amino acid transport system substrate-binding protein